MRRNLRIGAGYVTETIYSPTAKLYQKTRFTELEQTTSEKSHQRYESPLEWKERSKTGLRDSNHNFCTEQEGS